MVKQSIWTDSALLYNLFKGLIKSALTQNLNLEISDVENVYKNYFTGEKPYLKSKPTNLFLAQQNGDGVADFLFFSS